MVFVTEWIGKIASVRHLDAGVDVALAEAFEIDRLAMTLDQDDGAGNLSGGDLVVDEIVDFGKLFERQFRVRRRAEFGGG